jgi:hypothetical protein
MWGICKTVAIVVIGVTSPGILFCIFIVILATLFDYNQYHRQSWMLQALLTERNLF